MDDLPIERIQAIKDAFEILDEKKDGKVSAKKIGELIKTTGLTTVESEIQEYAKELEEDCNTSVDLIDYMKFYSSKLRDTESEDELKEAFSLFDKDGDGYITKDEFTQVLRNLNEMLSNEEIEDIIKEADIDGDGKISADEFKRVMKAK